MHDEQVYRVRTKYEETCEHASKSASDGEQAHLPHRELLWQVAPPPPPSGPEAPPRAGRSGNRSARGRWPSTSPSARATSRLCPRRNRRCLQRWGPRGQWAGQELHGEEAQAKGKQGTQAAAQRFPGGSAAVPQRFRSGSLAVPWRRTERLLIPAEATIVRGEHKELTATEDAARAQAEERAVWVRRHATTWNRRHVKRWVDASQPRRGSGKPDLVGYELRKYMV